MTGLAIELQMHAGQEEVLVILRGILPAAFVMALRTERTIGSLVNILVTGLAVTLWNFGEEIFPFEILWRRPEFLIRILVTFRTLHLLMLALQFEVGFLVIEFLQLRKLLSRMADAAGLVIELRMEHVFVFIYVAFLAEPAVRPFEHEFPAFTRRLGRQRKVAGLVAFAALLANVLVPTGKFETCDTVIKLRQFGKTTGSVTGRTGLFLEFAVELFLVNGLMAVDTVFFVFALIEVELMSRLGWLGW